MADIRILPKMKPRATGIPRFTPGKTGTTVTTLGGESSGVSSTINPRRQGPQPQQQGNAFMTKDGSKVELISSEEAQRRKGRRVQINNGQAAPAVPRGPASVRAVSAGVRPRTSAQAQAPVASGPVVSAVAKAEAK